ncbi:MAG: hypothetical protein Q9218_005082 [Villophora microphyllina]
MHKSNSTYFADFDIARMHLLTRLFPPGLVTTSRDLYREAGNTGPKRLGIYLGGVSCNFRREIGVLQGFEMWTRVLCWDRKWVYIITHFVKKGAFKPKGWSLQPWKNHSKPQPQEQATASRSNGNAEDGKTEKRHRFFATGIAKYVCKRGRLTIPPELILQNSGLLPPRPQNDEPQTSTETPPPPRPEETTDSSSQTPPEEEDATATLPASGAMANLSLDLSSSTADNLLSAALHTLPTSPLGEWTWNRIEQERQRGMKIMEAWNQTEALDEEFTGGEEMALGRYWDFP